MKLRLFAALLSAAFAASGAVARADQAADNLMKEVAQATLAVKSLSADVILRMKDGNQEIKSTGSFKMQRPTFVHIEMKKSPFYQTLASDGKTIWSLSQGNQYTTNPATAKNLGNALMPIVPAALFFDPDAIKPFSGSSSMSKILPSQTIEGVSYRVIEIVGDPITTHLFVAPDRLIHRVMLEAKRGAETSQLDMALQNIKIGTTLAPAAFAYTLPPGAKKFDPSAGMANLEKKLVAVGKEAPNFTLQSPAGGQVGLEDTLKGKKAVMVNFWFYT